MRLINMKKSGSDKKKECQFQLEGKDIQQIIPNMGYCFATKKITMEGMKIGYMYREVPDDHSDSGWRFFSGTENQDYVDDPSNIQIYDVNTIVNYDKAIIPYLHSPIGSEYERVEGFDNFKLL